MTEAYSGPLLTEKYRTAQKRFWAGIIDAIAFLTLSLADRYVRSFTDRPNLYMCWVMAALLVRCLYCVLPHAIWGQTIGKWVTSVKVLDVSETRTITLWQSLLRSSPLLFYLLTEYAPVLANFYAPSLAEGGFRIPAYILTLLFGGWAFADPIVLLVHPDRRALHDLIARTVVVRVNPEPSEIRDNP